MIGMLRRSASCRTQDSFRIFCMRCGTTPSIAPALRNFRTHVQAHTFVGSWLRCPTRPAALALPGAPGERRRFGFSPHGPASSDTQTDAKQSMTSKVLKFGGLMALTMFWWVPPFVGSVAVGSVFEQDTLKSSRVVQGSRGKESHKAA
mmetsp:Transcript_35667/g.48602  ORF Transcript_35667/g.48602 Transcript_35667/m.48602 type:complete len:148 (+) Transcript_35667:44-487(+)